MTRVGIGIDTGGTYTDAVAYDFDSGSILATAKSLTTKHDLSLGIAGALDGLPKHLTASPALVSLSTTLATNACVENKIGRARLVFFGGDERVIDGQGEEYGLPPSSEMLIQDGKTNYSDGVIGEVDWDAFLAAASDKLSGLDGIGIIEVYAMRNSGSVEKKAKALLRKHTDVPIVCGHELVSELNSLQRGASTLLNASLFPTIHAFIIAIKTAMAKRKITAPIVIVRSDGNLMSEEFAALRPAETLLCGPAASVMGCSELAREENCVIVDMGGTTTDIAVVKDGEPVKSENGIGIGKWKTFIKGLFIRTFGLGGDSAVHYNYAEKGVWLEEYRSVPLCIAASTHHGLLEQLRDEVRLFGKHTRYLHEGFILVRDIAGNPRYTAFEKEFCRILAGGPLLLRRAALAVGRDEYSLEVRRLLREGVVQMCGLTPTDIMHVRGDFCRFQRDASLLGARFAAESVGVGMEELCEAVYNEVRKKLYMNIVVTLLENENAHYRKNGVDPAVVDLVAAAYDRAKTGGGDVIDLAFKTDMALVGIGAPIHLFLGQVAEMLGARAVIPEHSSVANALGAIVGKIHAEKEVEIRPVYNTGGITGYTVFGNDGAEPFADRAEAEAFALAEAKAGACAEAVRRGATGEITVTGNLEMHDISTREGDVYLGTKAIAHAVGGVGF